MMDITAIQPAQNTPNPTGRIGRTALDTYQFLKLLVTELTSQNPLEPMKDRDFMAQLAQLNTAQTVERLGQVITTLQAASLIGKRIEAVLPQSGARVEGAVQWVEFNNGRVQLRVGEQLVPFEAIHKIL